MLEDRSAGSYRRRW